MAFDSSHTGSKSMQLLGDPIDLSLIMDEVQGQKTTKSYGLTDSFTRIVDNNAY